MSLLCRCLRTADCDKVAGKSKEPTTIPALQAYADKAPSISSDRMSHSTVKQRMHICARVFRKPALLCHTNLATDAPVPAAPLLVKQMPRFRGAISPSSQNKSDQPPGSRTVTGTILLVLLRGAPLDDLIALFDSMPMRHTEIRSRHKDCGPYNGDTGVHLTRKT